MRMILPLIRPACGEILAQPRHVLWEVKLASFLLVLSRVQQDRIERLEELNAQLAVALDRDRRRAA